MNKLKGDSGYLQDKPQRHEIPQKLLFDAMFYEYAMWSGWKALMPEAFTEDGRPQAAELSATTLRARLPMAIAAAQRAWRNTHGGQIDSDNPLSRMLIQFVEDFERDEKKHGPMTVTVS